MVGVSSRDCAARRDEASSLVGQAAEASDDGRILAADRAVAALGELWLHFADGVGERACLDTHRLRVQMAEALMLVGRSGDALRVLDGALDDEAFPASTSFERALRLLPAVFEGTGQIEDSATLHLRLARRYGPRDEAARRSAARGLTLGLALDPEGFSSSDGVDDVIGAWQRADPEAAATLLLRVTAARVRMGLTEGAIDELSDDAVAPLGSSLLSGWAHATRARAHAATEVRAVQDEWREVMRAWSQTGLPADAPLVKPDLLADAEFVEARQAPVHAALALSESKWTEAPPTAPPPAQRPGARVSPRDVSAWLDGAKAKVSVAEEELMAVAGLTGIAGGQALFERMGRRWLDVAALVPVEPRGGRVSPWGKVRDELRAKAEAAFARCLELAKTEGSWDATAVQCERGAHEAGSAVAPLDELPPGARREPYAPYGAPAHL